jgi:Ca2+:H+ antiporter
MRRAAAWLLYATIPVALFMQFTRGDLVWQFVFSCLAVLPVAVWIGHATEQLGKRMGPTYGALFNATFGNFAEFAIAIFAIRAGLINVVRASLTGSVVGNLLFVAGASMLAGGWKHQSVKFNALSAESQSGQLNLAVSAVLVPALFFRMATKLRHPELIHRVSIGISVILLISYALGLLFTFRTHSDKLAAVGEGAAVPDSRLWTRRKAILVLLGSSVLMGFVAEGLVRAVDGAGRAWGMNEVFLGFIVVAVVGNAAEHSSAVMLAARNQMDTALNISMQSSVQIALFVTPLLVFLSYPLGHPLDIVFTPFEILAAGIAVAVFSYLVLDGETNWYEGVQLLAVYAIVAIALYFLPATTQPIYAD